MLPFTITKSVTTQESEKAVASRDAGVLFVEEVIVRLLHSGFVRLCWLWGIGIGLCPEVVG